MELQNERDDDDVIDSLGGCRKGSNTIKPKRDRTGGLFIISTLSGFIVSLKEYIHRETSTEVLRDVPEAFISCPSHQKYFERMEALGYDNMCNLQNRIHNLGKQGCLSDTQAYVWSELRTCTFVDSFHLAKHTCPLCSTKHPDGNFCCFDTKLPKFKEICKNIENYQKNKKYYTKINDEVKISFIIDLLFL